MGGAACLQQYQHCACPAAGKMRDGLLEENVGQFEKLCTGCQIQEEEAKKKLKYRLLLTVN